MFQKIFLTFASLFVSVSMLHADSFPTDVSETQQTLSIIKPDAVRSNHIGEIITQFEKQQLCVGAIKMVKLSPEQAGEFYAEHKDRPFYSELVKFMTSGPIVVMVLEGKNAISKNREIMGATDPKKAAPGTLRATFAKSVTENSVHGSDSLESAKREISFFFKPNEILR
jgi:nucleoside-diphosphate kinase